MGGCTNCSGKSGCDHRKTAMFSSLDELMAALYPSKRWHERDEDFAFEQGFSESELAELAEVLGAKLKAATVFREGDDDEYCDYIDILCMGREPSILQCRDGGVALPDDLDPTASIQELYLRVCFSQIGRAAAVQQVSVSLSWQDDRWVVSEQARAGVYDAPLLSRMRKLVKILLDRCILHLDFGEISEPPKGYDGSAYFERYGLQPDIVGYLFSPRPASGMTTSALASPDLLD